MESLSKVFAALASDDRLAIVAYLLREYHRSVSIQQIAGEIDVSRFAASRHLFVLREAGLVHVERDGLSMLHSLQAARFEDVDSWLLAYLDLGVNDKVGPDDPAPADKCSAGWRLES